MTYLLYIPANIFIECYSESPVPSNVDCILFNPASISIKNVLNVA